jgi:hypothetical protein
MTDEPIDGPIRIGRVEDPVLVEVGTEELTQSFKCLWRHSHQRARAAGAFQRAGLDREE